MKTKNIYLIALILSLSNCTLQKEIDTHPTEREPASNQFPGYLQIRGGVASMYADSLAGNPTSSGKPYNPRLLTAAHRSLPFGTIVKVVHSRTYKSVDVVINDRGPYADNRVIDLSRAAAQAVGIVNTIGPVLLFDKRR